MPAYESVAVPFRTKGNRQYLELRQLAEDPCLEDFVRRFRRCFEFDPVLNVFWFDREGGKHGQGTEGT